MKMMRSWVESANSAATDFPLNNLPCGVFSIDPSELRCGVAIGDFILDVTALESEGLLVLAEDPVFDVPFWNEFMDLGPKAWADFRNQVTALLVEGASKRWIVEDFLIPIADAEMHLAIMVSEFTDFYSSKHHAMNVGRLLRGADNALTPNWLHLPIGYNGRASSVVVSGTDIRRPLGQTKPAGSARSVFGPSLRFDFELELGAIVGRMSEAFISVAQADENIFGYVLLNDWSARDIQAWEYQPLGPFQAKATATTISPWIVMKAALEPFRITGPVRDSDLLPYLREPGPMLYDIQLEVGLTPALGVETILTRTTYAHMYYSSAQQLCHHTTSGCRMNVGDILGTGTISGPLSHERGSLIEISSGGKEPISVDGGTRSFLEDGDTVVLRGWANGEDYKIGFGPCVGQLLTALPVPDWAK
jgi:fumarylacetoacetase